MNDIHSNRSHPAGAAPLSLATTVLIAPGLAMPLLGFGTYKSKPGEEAHTSVLHALELGYRHIDTAALYENEADVGEAVRESGVRRDEVFITTKVWDTEQGYDTTLAAFDKSLAKLGTPYVDLYLVHWPKPALAQGTWRAMEEIHASGRARAIGVCNHLPHHLEALLAHATVPPAVNQVEFHPRLQQPDLQRFCAQRGITLEAWAPIMRGGVFHIPEILTIAERHAKSAAQVTLRWILQKDIVAIPKSVHKDRIAENAALFDFELSAGEMATIDALDTGERIGPHPDHR
jgi:diketogulonate reductase-like aldo/keto reductase